MNYIFLNCDHRNKLVIIFFLILLGCELNNQDPYLFIDNNTLQNNYDENLLIFINIYGCDYVIDYVTQVLNSIENQEEIKVITFSPADDGLRRVYNAKFDYDNLMKEPAVNEEIKVNDVFIVTKTKSTLAKGYYIGKNNFKEINKIIQ